MNIYQIVAMNEQNTLGQKIKAYVAEKSGYSGLKTAGAMTSDINRLSNSADFEKDLAYEQIGNAKTNLTDALNHGINGHAKEQYADTNNASYHIGKADEHFQRAYSDQANANAAQLRQKKLKDAAARQMQNFGANTGAIGGTIIGAAAGKGYGAYQRYRMKKRGATKEELAAHKKGDLKRMAAGAAIGGLALGQGGKAIGGKIADRTFNKECERLNKIECR